MNLSFAYGSPSLVICSTLSTSTLDLLSSVSKTAYPIMFVPGSTPNILRYIVLSSILALC